MTEERVQRRLAAILVADVVGYSRLMEADEAGTLAALKARRRDVLGPLMAKHQGRIFKSVGDGVMVEFASAVNAVACAVELQQAMAAASAGQPEQRRIVLRIGVNVGDVVVQGSDLFGDGVNIAARLEAIAEPGGIVISETGRDHVGNRLEVAFEDLGPQLLKNLAQSVRAYRVTAGDAVAPIVASGPATKPSVAVLPFTNMSDDPQQEYFSDGITEDIITALSRFPGLFVVARNSCFTFKGQAVDMRTVGHKLGAAFVVEGSVQKAGKRVRVTAQLIETKAGTHLWAQRYDRDLDDIFAVQDDLVIAIAGAIPGQLDRVAVDQLRRNKPSNLTAYDCELRGRWALNHWNEGPLVAIEWFERAIKADPGYALAHAGLAMACSYGVFVLGLPPDTTLARAKMHAHRAVVLDDRNSVVSAYAAFTYHLSGEYRLARTYAERAVSQNPNDPFVLFLQATTLCYASGEHQQALQWFEKSERIEPYAPDDMRIDSLGDCYYMLREYQKVVEIHDVYVLPPFLKLVLAAAHAQMGQRDRARAAIEEYERTRPAGHDPAAMIGYHLRLCGRQEDRDHWLEGYRKAGLPV